MDLKTAERISVKDGLKAEAIFSYYKNTGKPCRPSTLEAKVKDNVGTYKWAFI